MTENELLEYFRAGGKNLLIQRYKDALRSVIELHNQGNTGECGDADCCGGFTPDICGHCHDEYPCETIQSIVKTLTEVE